MAHQNKQFFHKSHVDLNFPSTHFRVFQTSPEDAGNPTLGEVYSLLD